MKTIVSTLSLCAFVLVSGALSAETVTIPAVASLPVGSAASPFFSDVRVFNTSYTSSVSVTAVYRCFIPEGCSAAGRSENFSLSPRESKEFIDMVQATFNAPSTGGAVEFTSSGSDIRVTSRLYSPELAERLAAGVPGGTNGMFIPGLRNSEAHAVSVLTSLANGAFRTNIGVYNGEDSPVVATIRLFNGSTQLGTQTVNLGPRSGRQINRIFDGVGQAGVTSTNAYAVVETNSAGAEVFTYAAVIDNATADSSFVSGAEDVRAPPGPTATPGAPQSTPTPTPTPTTVSTTVVNLTAEQFRWSFNGGGTSFTLRAGQVYEIHMRTLDVTHGFPGVPVLGLASAALNPGAAEIVQTIRPTAAQIGTFVFACDIFCGSGHGFQGSIQVTE